MATKGEDDNTGMNGMTALEGLGWKELVVPDTRCSGNVYVHCTCTLILLD